MLRTFLDSGVLIAAFRGTGADRDLALDVVGDSDRRFVVSPFLYLELIPKAVFHKRPLERAFYERYFQQAESVRNLSEIAVLAQAEAERCGLAAMDALHVAAAHLGSVEEFVTTEKLGAPFYRSSLIKVVYLYG